MPVTYIFYTIIADVSVWSLWHVLLIWVSDVGEKIKNWGGLITIILRSRPQVSIASESTIVREGPYWPLQHNFKPLQQPSQL